MTADRFHDAITLLPADLIAEADRRRSGNPKRLPWKRYAALAACFVLILFAGRYGIAIFAPKGGAKMTESAAMDVPAAAAPEAAPMEAAEDEAAPANGSAAQDRGASGTCGIQSDTAPLAPGFLDAAWVYTPYGDAASHSSVPYVTLITNGADLEAYVQQASQDRTGLMAHGSYQEEGWFDRYDLAAVRLPLAEPELLQVRETEAGWTILLPEPGQEAQSYHLLLTVEKGLIPSGEQIHIDFA